MPIAPRDVAQVRLENAHLLFEEFVRATARHADAAALRGLERRFAERVLIQPSYWSQIKSRSRQIGERLARQFEARCNKPVGWMDQPHDSVADADTDARHAYVAAPSGEAMADDSSPQNDDERFILALVLTYYRRHPQRAKARLLDLLGEVLVPGAHRPSPKDRTTSSDAKDPPVEDSHGLWVRSQGGVSPLKRRK